jgi:hypothetical protein
VGAVEGEAEAVEVERLGDLLMAPDDAWGWLDKRAKLATEMRLRRLGIRPTEKKPKLPRRPTADDLRKAGLGFHDS